MQKKKTISFCWKFQTSTHLSLSSPLEVSILYASASLLYPSLSYYFFYPLPVSTHLLLTASILYPSLSYLLLLSQSLRWRYVPVLRGQITSRKAESQ